MVVPRVRPRPLLCKLVVLLAAVLLLPAPQQQRFAQSQGLDVSDPTLLGGSELTAAEFLNFEDALSLSAQNLGGRGRGGRGGSGNLGGGAYRTAEEFKRLQTAIYYISGSPQNWESLRDINVTDATNNTVTLGERLPVRDQGVTCNTCVGQAVASAIQMSLATRFKDWKQTAAAFDSWSQVQDKFGVNPPNLEFDIDARSLYYCTEGGRTCKTGWDIPDALKEVLTSNRQWLRPQKCIAGSLSTRDSTPEEAIDDWSKICKDASEVRKEGLDFARQNVSTECFNITNAPSNNGTGPLYECTYSSLSNFWQIQRHIRNHGSVITRIYIPDDFGIFLNGTAKTYNGYSRNRLNNADSTTVWRPYTLNVTAKPAFGHAALIVGYDNEEYTWTILNSWGTTNSSGPARFNGITQDGTFKVKMGLLGVGTPEATYGVRCAPRKGGPLDPGGGEPWAQNQTKVWTYVDETQNDTTGCLQAYASVENKDRLFAIVDYNGVGDGGSIDIVRLLQENNSYRYLGYQPKIFSYKYSYRMTEEQLYNVWTVVRNNTRKLVTSVRQGCSQAGDRESCTPNNQQLYLPNPTHPWPYLECTFWSASGQPTFPVQCPPARFFDSTGQNIDLVNQTHFADCAKNGTVACNLYYTDIDLEDRMETAGATLVSQVCNPKWPPFDDFYQYAHPGTDPNAPSDPSVPPTDNFADASSLNALLDSVDGAWRDANFTVNVTRQQQRRQQQKPITFRNLTGCFTPDVTIKAVINITGSSIPRTIDWYMKCEKSRVVELSFRVRPNERQNAAVLQASFDTLVDPLRRLSELRVLNMTVYDGSRLGELAALQNLRSLSIYHVCMTASLPENLVPGLPSLTNLTLTSDRDYVNFVPGSTSAKCGWNGAVPDFWVGNSHLTLLNLTGNQLSGGLPNTLIAQWPKLEKLLLGGNLLSGRIPDFTAWTTNPGNASITEIDFSGNNFQGDFPAAWKAFRGRLGALKLDGNADLTGCVPLDDRTNVTTSGTRNLTLCNFDEETQVAAVDLLNATLGSGTVSAAYKEMLNRIKTRLQGLGTLVPPSGSRNVAFIAESRAEGSVNVTVEDFGGREYITSISATNGGVNLNTLVNLTRGLPKLSAFECQRCDKNAASRQVLPPGLQAAAPGLTKLTLTNSAIAGQLPSEWRAWGQRMEVIDVAGNGQLRGTVPANWSTDLSQCVLNVTNTGITSCVAAGGLYVIPDLPGCVSESTLGELGALQSLYNTLKSFGGKSAELDKWIFANAVGAGRKNYCSWPGLGCDDSNAITTVDLSALKLAFPVPSPPKFESIVKSMLPGLENVTHLSLAGVGVDGPIPELLLDFEFLERLDISNNSYITGDLPEVLAGLTSLQYFWLSSCPKIISELPVAYAALIDLVEFRAAGCNGLFGIIPAEWALLKNLKVLELSETSIDGPIPDLSVNPPQTAAALLAKAQAAAGPADGGIAAAASSKQAAAAKAAVRIAAKLKAQPQQADDVPGLASLEQLILQNNQLTGPVPTSLGNLLKLQVINLSGNQLIGGLPTAWSRLNQLQELCVSYNSINGTLPRPYNRLSNLKKFDVGYNSISGPLPDIYVSLKKLERFDVSYNAISGNAPRSWRNFGGRTYKLVCLSVVSNPGLNLASLPDFTQAKRKGIQVQKEPSDPAC